MDITFQSLILLPVVLGLLGFIEPCTIGGHLLFLDTQKDRGRLQKINAVLVFLTVRSMVAGSFGAMIAYLGQQLISIQTDIWLIFGLIYLALGLAFFIGKDSLFKKQFDFAPSAWKQAKNPVMLGLAFGLNIPACAAPILYGLLGLAATTGTIIAGFAMMFTFGLFLSLPLVAFAIIPSWTERLENLGQSLVDRRWILGGLFVVLGLWSIWFGLYVNPKDWAML